jgi:DNA-binding HxlR family transcriptional regulator
MPRTKASPALQTAPVQTSPRFCPAMLALELIANKWAVRILYTLAHSRGKILRFSQIQKALGSITQRELTKQLRAFEEAGIMQRIVYAEVPPRVEYTLTTLGLSLIKPIDALSKWAETYGAKVQKNREGSQQDA